MKTCTKCKIAQSENEYHKYAKYKDGLFPICKKCRCDGSKKYNRKNAKAVKAYKNKYNADYTKWARSFKENKSCTDCEGSFHPAAMQWDHLPGTEKVIDLARVMTKDQFFKEIKKCELVCANCHAIRTYERTINDKKM